MKIKMRPEDFVVEELLTEVPLQRNGPYALYLLRKKGANTVELLKTIARQSGIPYEAFSYGGRKDKHASTSQYITIKSRSPVQSSSTKHSLTFLGCRERPMGPDLIQGNKFSVVVRDLIPAEAAKALRGFEEVTRYGYANYFDDQRFGSYDTQQGFLAEKVLKKQYNGALKIYLTRISSEDRAGDKERKRAFFRRWGDWRYCREYARTPFERRAFRLLERGPAQCIALLREIPADEMSLFFSAYQSYLWNELLRRLIQRVAGEHVRRYTGAIGDYYFYEDIPDTVRRSLDELHIPLFASRVSLPDPSTRPGHGRELAQGFARGAEQKGATDMSLGLNSLTKELYEAIAAEQGITPAMANLKKIRQAFFKGSVRKAIVIPGQLVAARAPDELHTRKEKVTLQCVLPRGSYATMVTKRLFAL